MWVRLAEGRDGILECRDSEQNLGVRVDKQFSLCHRCMLYLCLDMSTQGRIKTATSSPDPRVTSDSQGEPDIFTNTQKCHVGRQDDCAEPIPPHSLPQCPVALCP